MVSGVLIPATVLIVASGAACVALGTPVSVTGTGAPVAVEMAPG